MRRMRVSIHLSTIDRAIGGALYYYGEISRLVSQCDDPDLEVMPHDIYELLAADEAEQRRFVESLNQDDVVISAIGPYAYIYFYLRERFHGKFRIVRDIRTTSWGGFLLQEQLVAPLLREGDILLCPSEFARQYFITLFAGLAENNVFFSYPLADSFPEKVIRKESRFLRIGYIGRISENKNLAQVLGIYKSIRSREKVVLHLAGQVSFNSRHVNQKKMLWEYLRAYGVNSEDIIYHGYLHYNDIWRFYSNVDVLLFPALANVESLGRVLVESARAGVPVVASNYAASPELLPIDNIVSTRYDLKRDFSTLGAFSFGSVDENDSIEKVLDVAPTEDVSRRTSFQTEQFFRYLKGDLSNTERPHALGGVIEAFLRSLVLSGLPRLTFDESMKTSAALCSFFAYYNNNHFRHRLRLLLDATSLFQRDRGAAHLYLDRALRPKNRLVLKHASQFCERAGCKPIISLKPSDSDRALLLSQASQQVQV